MFRLQGMNPDKFVVDVSERTLGQQIGNAMSVNVIERVFLSSLKAAGLIDQAAPDRWANGEALAELKSSKGKVFHKLVRNNSDGEKRMTVELAEKAAAPADASVNNSIRFVADCGASLHLVDRKP